MIFSKVIVPPSLNNFACHSVYRNNAVTEQIHFVISSPLVESPSGHDLRRPVGLVNDDIFQCYASDEKLVVHKADERAIAPEVAKLVKGPQCVGAAEIRIGSVSSDSPIP